MSLPTGLANAPAYPNSFGAPAGAVVSGARKRLSYSTGAGVAGVYTASIVQPGGSVLVDAMLHAIDLWNAGTSATGKVGDTTDDDGIYTAINLKATDLLAGESISVWLAGGKAGADIANSQWNRRYSAADRTISFIVTTVGVGTTGETLFDLSWFWPSRGDSAGTFV